MQNLIKSEVKIIIVSHTFIYVIFILHYQIFQPHFQTPTLPNNTKVACPASRTCHIVFSLSPGLNEGWYACTAHYQIDTV